MTDTTNAMTTTETASDTSVNVKLMECIRSYPILYDRGCSEFKEKDKKLNAWREVSKEVKLDMNLCIKRYETIRTTFGRYLKTLRVKLCSDSWRDGVGVIVDKKYNHLIWLIPFIKHKGPIVPTRKRTREEKPEDKEVNLEAVISLEDFQTKSSVTPPATSGG